MSEKIKYVKHPVSPEQKKKLREQGFKIIDARFDPNPKKERANPAAKGAAGNAKQSAEKTEE